MGLFERIRLIIGQFGLPDLINGLATKGGGLALSVDGRSNWPSYSFSWGVGETHHVSASARQIDSQGRTYNFQWSNGGPPARS